MRRLLLAAVLSACAAPSAQLKPSEEAAPSPLQLRLLTRGKKVIPLTYAFDSLILTNVKPPDLVITNGGAAPIPVRRLDLIGRAGGVEQVRLAIAEAELTKVIAKSGPALKALFADRAHADGAAVRFGRSEIDPSTLCAEPTLPPGQSLLLPLAALRYLEFVGKKPLDELLLEVHHDGAVARLSLPLSASPSKNSYSFPLKQERLLIANLPLNLPQHRAMHSQEFAMDIVAIGPDGAALRTASAAKPKELSQYFVYRRDVMAVGEGTVVEAGTGFPEAEMKDAAGYSEELFTQLMKRLIPEIGFKNSIAGNYLVIDHGDGEFGFYAHLSEVGKKVGDKVSRGEVVGKVGNTGHSTEPHLHFQLMDGPDFLTANGLPIWFSDVKVAAMGDNYRKANSLFSSDFVLLAE